MGWFSRKVNVAFIDEATGAVFATSKMLVDNLPDSFEIDTTLHLGDDDWSVVGADPKLKSEFAKSKYLTIWLRKLMWMDPKELSFSQLDITDRFDDNHRLGPDDWIDTTPLNANIKDLESAGLPALDADCDEVYRVASAMSDVRESIRIPGDGVYCPICHIANVEIAKLRTPCPKCGRGLLKFGWT